MERDRGPGRPRSVTDALVPHPHRALAAARAPVATLALAAALTLGAAACGGTSAPSAASSTATGGEDMPSGGGELVLRVRDGGGFVPTSSAAVPRLSLYGDGALVTSPSETRYGLPDPQVAHLSRAEVRSVVRAAEQAGLPHAGTLGPTPPADGPTRSYEMDGRTTTTIAPALRDCTEQQALCALDKRLGTLAEHGTAYRYTAVAAVFHETGKGRSLGAMTWPLRDLSRAGEPTRAGQCLLIKGQDLTRVKAAARTASSGAWTDGAATYQVTLRPLLPGEKSCTDVSS